MTAAERSRVPTTVADESAIGANGGPLHRRLRTFVLERVLRGEFGAGDRVSVSRIAVETGVSRTPVRETLLQLQREGFLTLEVNRGFFVRKLTEEGARELYPILHCLEDLALSSGGRPPPRQLETLENLNRQLSGCSDPEEAIDINLRWHSALTAHANNDELKRLLGQYRMRIYSYELAYYRGGDERLEYSHRDDA